MLFRSVLLPLCLLCLPLRALAAVPSLEGGRDLYFQGQVTEAEAAFDAVMAANDATPADRTAAALERAQIAWLIDGNYAAATGWITRARGFGGDTCPVAAYEARLDRESHKPEQAEAVAGPMAADCPAGDRNDTQLEAARAALDLGDTAAARIFLGLIPAASALAPDVQAAWLRLALMTGDDEGAIRAWRGFYWLTEGDAPDGMGLAPGAATRIFHDGLKKTASDAARLDLLRLLIRGGFYELALAYDHSHGVAKPMRGTAAYRPVAAYYDFRDRLARLTLDFNRGKARGASGSDDAYITAVTALMDETAKAVAPKGETAAVLKNAYGLYGTVGMTGGTGSLHMGHIVDDSDLQVAQFGRTGKVGFLVIDNMVSNGFQSWLWDGRAATGGWAESHRIIQVRPAYTVAAMQALNAVTPEGRARADSRATQLADGDLARLKDQEIGYLPGVAMRLQIQAGDEIATVARQAAQQQGLDFETIFLRTYWDDVVDHSITVHEGRHVLDKQTFGDTGLADDEMEFRAKLSELELAKMPKLALANIMSANMGDGTPHGNANQRVIAGLVDWMKGHAQHIAGFDATVPYCAQLDKLSDSDLREAATAMDPQTAK